MATKLKNLVITKVALVDEGSCSAAHIKLYKRKEGGEGMSKTLEDILKGLSQEDQDVVNGEITKAKAELPEGALSPEDKKKLEDEKKKAEMEKSAAFDELSNMKKSKEDNSDEEILKNLDPAVKAVLEKAKNQAAAAEAIVLKMKEDADTAEALAKAKELGALGLGEEELAKSLKDLKNTNDAVYDNIFGILKTANNAIAKGAFEEKGASGEGADTLSLEKAKDASWGAIEVKAEEFAKSRNITKEAAVSAVIKECPELYKKYMDTLK